MGIAEDTSSTWTSITIKRQTRDALASLKEHPRETWDDLLLRIVEAESS